MTIVAAFLLLQEPFADVNRLILDLGNGSIEVRESAQRDLVRLGPSVLPALRTAIATERGERKTRARRTAEHIECVERERAHDAKEWTDLVGESGRDPDPKGWVIHDPRMLVSVGGRSRDPGIVLHTYCVNRLLRYDSTHVGEVRFNEVRATAPDGSVLPLEMCGRCSPKQILIKEHKGPFRVTMRGTQTWFSRYDLCFENPRPGDMQRVGDMTVTIEWPRVSIVSNSGWSEYARRTGFEFFAFELIPGSIFVKPSQPSKGIMGGCGNGSRIDRSGWCECDGGPLVRDALSASRRTYGYTATAKTRDIPLDDVLRIKLTVWKPHEVPFEFTTDVTPWEMPRGR